MAVERSRLQCSRRERRVPERTGTCQNGIRFQRHHRGATSEARCTSKRNCAWRARIAVLKNGCREAGIPFRQIKATSGKTLCGCSVAAILNIENGPDPAMRTPLPKDVEPHPAIAGFRCCRSASREPSRQTEAKFPTVFCRPVISLRIIFPTKQVNLSKSLQNLRPKRR